MQKVLVVDDDPVIVSMLKKFLESKDYQVLTAADGVDALQEVNRENPKVVLLDIDIPSKDGLEVLQEIKRRDRNTGIIMITAMADDAIGQSALAAGAFDYITKPFDWDYLERVLWWKLRLMD
ncbi:MAG: response regulator [Acidobacteria bacterium]|nr:response regulator [Acidobacteriota bacterium]